MKNKNIYFMALIIMTILAAMFPVKLSQAEQGVFRVAFIEEGPYDNYAGNLNGLTSALSRKGIVESISDRRIEEGSSNEEATWQWLSNHANGGVEFVSNEFYQLLDMSKEEKNELIRHLNEDDKIDLILVMGTAAAKFMRDNNIQTDMMIMSASNAYASGFINSMDYSGIHNVWAQISPNRYYNQLNVFYNLFHFKKLGIVYVNSQVGTNEIAYEDIRRFTKLKGIDLIEIPVLSEENEDDPQTHEKKMIEAYHRLAGKVDAVYMTYDANRTPEKIPDYLTPLYDCGIPIFSQTGKNEVSNGATLTIERDNFNEMGSFCAEQFVKIMEGRLPGTLIQTYDESQTICFNLAAAERGHIKLPFKALLSADRIFTEIGENDL